MKTDFTPLFDINKDPFEVFKNPEVSAMLEALIRARFSPVDGVKNSSAFFIPDSVSRFMRHLHPRSRKVWAPRWEYGYRSEKHAAMIAASEVMQASGNALWRGYLLQMADMLLINFLADGTVFEVDLHVKFEELLPSTWPYMPAEIATILDLMYRPNHPVRQILFASDSHYLIRILQGKP